MCSRCLERGSDGWSCSLHGMSGEQQCPWDQIDDQTLEWMRMYSWLTRDGGGLWGPGSVGEQPARDLRAMEVLGHHLRLLTEARTEREREHLAGGGRG